MHASKPYVLGLTGGIGTGKTVAADYLVTLGARLLDADEASRRLTAPGGEALSAIREAFGDGVFHPDGALDRRALGDVVFGDAAQRRRLEGILHPAVQRDLLAQLDEAGRDGAQVCVLSVPLLFETGMDALCDEVWVTSVDAEQQVLRVMNRDQITRKQAQARIDSQMPAREKEERADRVIRTGRPVEETRHEMAHAYRELMKKLM